jgi:hypothetical protein
LREFLMATFPIVSPAPPGSRGAWLAVAAAVMLALITTAPGPPVFSKFGGHDAPFAIGTLAALHDAGGGPGYPPGWLATLNQGFGAPLLFFYPPAGFLLGAMVQAAGVTDAATALMLALLLARIGGLVFCYLWLRCIAPPRAALLGAAAYALFPYNTLLNPIIRFAYAEAVAAGLLPLLLLAIAAPALAPHRRVVAVAAAFALVGATNVPTALMALACGGVYALGIGWRRAVQTGCGFVLGVGLLGFHLIPALLLSAQVSTAALMDEGHSWRGTMLFWGSMATRQVNLIWWVIYAIFGLAALAALALWRRAPATPQHRAVLLASLCTLAFVTPLTLPVWWLLPPLAYVQFPWRFLMPASLFFGAAVALLGAGAPSRRMAGLGLGVTALAAVPALFLGLVAVVKPAERLHFAGGQARVEEERAIHPYGPPEFIPRAARAAGWIPFSNAEQSLPGAPTAPVVAAGRAMIDGVRRDGAVLHLSGHADTPAALLLPLFSFPGWAVTGGSGTLTTDPQTGLLRLTLPPGPFAITVARHALPVTRLGAVVSSGLLAGALAILLLPSRRLRPAAPRAQQDLGAAPGQIG